MLKLNSCMHIAFVCTPLKWSAPPSGWPCENHRMWHRKYKVHVRRMSCELSTVNAIQRVKCLISSGQLWIRSTRMTLMVKHLKSQFKKKSSRPCKKNCWTRCCIGLRDTYNIKNHFTHYRVLGKAWKHKCLIHVDFSEKYLCIYAYNTLPNVLLHSVPLKIKGPTCHQCLITCREFISRGLLDPFFFFFKVKALALSIDSVGIFPVLYWAVQTWIHHWDVELLWSKPREGCHCAAKDGNNNQVVFCQRGSSPEKSFGNAQWRGTSPFHYEDASESDHKRTDIQGYQLCKTTQNLNYECCNAKCFTFSDQQVSPKAPKAQKVAVTQ